jgi:two-component system NarL family sensor kinase
MRTFSISDKLIMLFVAINIVAVGTVGYFSFFNSEDALNKRIDQQLTTIKTVKKRQIEKYFVDRKNEIQLLIALINDRNLVNKTSDSLKLASIQMKSDHYSNIFELSNSNSSIGERLLTDIKKYIESSKQSASIAKLIEISYPELNQYHLFIIQGVKSEDNEEEVIVFELNQENINRIMVENSANDGFGESGESYLIGNDKLMRSESRFIKNATMRIKVDTKGSQSALNSESGFASYKDYREIVVLGSYGKINVNGLNWFILVEIDKLEAVKDIFIMRNKMFLLVILTSIGVIIMTLIIARKISSPVKNLTKAALNLMNGTFEKIDYNSKDEIGDLVTTFNAMGEKIITQEEELKRANKKTVRASFDATDKERKRLALELHDDIGQRLIGTKLILENIESDHTELLTNQLELAKQSIDLTIQEIRNLTNNLLPSVINEFGLATAIKTLCDDIVKISGINIDLTSNLKHEDINTNVKVYLFRLVQEAVSNILQHSEADRILINLELKDNILQLEVKDNGKGFDESMITMGNGLINMRERVSLLDGEIKIITNVGKGTEIFVTIPVKDNN